MDHAFSPERREVPDSVFLTPPKSEKVFLPPATLTKPNIISKTKSKARLAYRARRLPLSPPDELEILHSTSLMRFDRNAACRDSRRKTAIRLQKKRSQPIAEEVEDVQPFRRVQFANPTDIRKRPKQRRFHMAVIAEARPSSALSHISALDGSPYRRALLITDTSPQNDSDQGRHTALESCSKNGHAEIRADVEQVVTQGSAFPGSQEGMERSTQEASEGAEMYDRDPLADGGIPLMSEPTQSRDMKIFKKILRDPFLREPFITFLEQQFCAENINFYLAVEKFRDLAANKDSTHAERSASALKIYERHFAANCIEPVNVDNSTSKRIRQTMKERMYPPWTFDIAQYQIFHLLKYDCWPRFLRAGGQQPEFTDDELADEDERIARLELLEDMTDLQTPRAIVDPDKPCTSAAPSTSEAKKLSEKGKQRSLLWHGFDRFSRKLRGELSPSCIVSPSHKTVHRTTSSEESRRTLSENDSTPVRTIGSAGTKRRQLFTTSKQLSMPAEMTTIRPPVSKREPKHCRLMTGENCSTEVIELTDPTISVRNWTQQMAGTLGLDKKAVEVVDAETGSTIDPARQAVDALQSRSVRIVPVVTFAVEILPPNFSFKNPSSTPTKIIMVRARHSMTAGGVLRPLLSKYSIDFGAVVVTYCGTLETIRSNISIGNVGPRTLTVMSQTQFNDRTSKKDLPLQRDPMATSPNLAAEHNLQFHQHGDVSYCELPSDADRMKHQQKDSPLSFVKFMRKASAAVSSKDENSTRHKSSGRRKSVGQSGGAAGVYCGEEQQPEPQKESGKKRLSIFKKSKDKCDTPSPSTPVPTQARDSPRPQAREPCCSSSVGASPKAVPAKKPVTPHTSNGDAPPRTPAIFTSRICAADEDEGSAKDHGWQPAAYV